MNLEPTSPLELANLFAAFRREPEGVLLLLAELGQLAGQMYQMLHPAQKQGCLQSDTLAELHSLIGRSVRTANGVESRVPDAAGANPIQGALPLLSRAASTICAPEVFLTRLENDRLVGPEPTSLENARKIAKKRRYSIVIDEPADQLHVRKSGKCKKQSIFRIRRMQRGMLWLVLTHVGGCIKREEIAELFKFEAGYDPRRLYQYPIELKELVGSNLRSRMLERGAARRLPVRDGRWSFCWIRRNEECDRSELINDLANHLKPNRDVQCVQSQTQPDSGLRRML